MPLPPKFLRVPKTSRTKGWAASVKSVACLRHNRIMPWKRLALRYAWTIAVRETSHAQGWSPESVNPVTLVGLVVSVPVAGGTVLPYLYWLFTGKGPWRSWGLSSSIVVDPFPGSQSGLLVLKRELDRRSPSASPGTRAST